MANIFYTTRGPAELNSFTFYELPFASFTQLVFIFAAP